MSGYDGRGTKFPLTIVRGADMAFSLTVTDDAGAAVNVSAATIAGEVYTTAGVLVDTLTAVVSGAGSNVVTLSFTATQTAALTSDSYQWTLWVTRGADKRPWLAGPVRVTAGTNGGRSTSGTTTLTVDGNLSVAVTVAGATSLSASAVTLADTAGNYASSTVEGALAELPAQYAPGGKPFPLAWEVDGAHNLTVAESGLASLYYPWMWHAAEFLADPLDEWYLYYSTDHAAGTGGIGLATAPSPLGPWTAHGSNPIYTDTVDGNQTETPSIVWDADNQRVMLFYHQIASGGGQFTRLAYSSDGVTGWTRQAAISFDRPTIDNVVPGAAHTGYARVYRSGGGLFAWSLFGDGDRSGSMIWRSQHGYGKWAMDFQAIAPGTRYGLGIKGYEDHAIAPIGASYIEWQGERWMVGNAVNAAGTSRISVAVPLCADRWTFAGPAVIIDTGSDPDISMMYVHQDKSKLWAVFAVRVAGLITEFRFGQAVIS